MSSAAASAGGGSRQNATPNRSHKSPERPRGGKSRRTLIESACTSCQKRKSKCDGQRPACSRCQALHTECGYNAEEGESRWSALRRRNRTLERERDEARDLIAQLQSRPEPEAEEIYHRLRTASHNNDLGAFIHEAVTAMSNLQQQQQQQQQQGQSGDQTQRPSHVQQGHQPTMQPYQNQQQQPQQAEQRQQPAQQQSQSMFAQHNYATSTSATQLPPLRSMFEMPAGGHNTQQPPQPLPTMSHRNMSQVSAMSSSSYTSLSSSDGHGGSSVSPRENLHPGWTQGTHN